MKQGKIYTFYYDMEDWGMFFGTFANKEVCNKFMVDKYYDDVCAYYPDMNFSKENFIDDINEVEGPWLENEEYDIFAPLFDECTLLLDSNEKIEDIKEVWMLLDYNEDCEWACPKVAFTSKEKAIKGYVKILHEECDNGDNKLFESEQMYEDYASQLFTEEQDPQHVDYDMSYNCCVGVVHLPLISY